MNTAVAAKNSLFTGPGSLHHIIRLFRMMPQPAFLTVGLYDAVGFRPAT